MSNTALEAMASGLPVVCTPVGANVDLVTHDQNGKLACVDAPEDVAQKILEYMLDANQRRVHGERARSFVECHHSLETMTKRYVQLYESTTVNGVS
jgi:glycosyltransferase involved in cell wall biosynthesis